MSDAKGPISDRELIAKYEECAGMRLSPKAVERSKQLLLSLEKTVNISELVDIISLTAPEGRG